MINSKNINMSDHTKQNLANIKLDSANIKQDLANINMRVSKLGEKLNYMDIREVFKVLESYIILESVGSITQMSNKF